MQYPSVVPGRFLQRPNRFVALVETREGVQRCHVKNTGRCRELLLPGAQVWLQRHSDPARKTAYSLIAVQKGGLLINMDSQAPNRAVREWLEAGLAPAADGWPVPGITLLRPEYRYGDSRFDFYLEAGDRRIFLEVKGVTLEQEGVVLFPDAPTERGLKHLRGLAASRAEGYEAAVLFVVQMQGPRRFTPNRATDPAFADGLAAAREAGVQLLARDCRVTPDSMVLANPVEIIL